MQQATESAPPPKAGGRGHYWRLISRFAAASVVATGISQLVFVGSYALGALPVVSTVLAWLAGAVPNFVLNRRTWGGGGRSALRGEIVRYAALSVGTALLAAMATSGAERLALAEFPHDRLPQVAIVWGAFLATYLVMFVVKFFIIDRFIFTARERPPRAR
ncbi:GtrA family protein [Saccharopolyspora gloriosae]|uniref:GtrA family protein n=1 Tax=Saccharopolyspora gloriosae TaxID=455344 RepID=UPI001FB82A71|nr:GtrA family protein [Saccharopolyspora gloriosae]